MVIKNKKYNILEIYPTEDKQSWIDIVRLQIETLPDDEIKLPDLGNWFIAYHDLKPIAYAGMVDKTPPTKRKIPYKICYFIRAGVIEEYRGYGIQYDLLQKRIEKAKELDYKRIITTTYENPWSSNNLIKCGFKMYDSNEKLGIEGTNYWELIL